MQGIDRIKLALEYFQQHQHSLSLEPPVWPEYSHLSLLKTEFQLSNFEIDLILLCAGCEIDPVINIICGEIRGNSSLNAPTLMLALAVLPEANFSILSPEKPLLSWQLITMEPHAILTQAPLKIDHRLLCYLLGEDTVDPKLQGYVRSGQSRRSPIPLAQSHQELVEQAIQSWSSQQSMQEFPVLQLCGSDIQTSYQIAEAIAAEMGFNLQVITAKTLPQNIKELYHLRLIWEREAMLSWRILLLDAYEVNPDNTTVHSSIKQWIEFINTPLIVGSEDRYSSQRRPMVTHTIPSLNYEERKQLWQDYLGSVASELNGQLERIAGQFHLNVNGIQTASQQMLATSTNQPDDWSQQLWSICRMQARPRLQDLAQYIQPKASWDDLVLPEGLQDILQEMAAHLRQRVKVQEEWGFRKKNSRGLGLSALFAGGSGTGKTMAAEVLGQELQLDVFRIDLSAVTSKYIGETEKNLQRIFDAAEVGGTILLFDEADAMFGKRTEVKDSRDRYANIEVSYLLQRMEAYQGLAILTTNLKDSIDQAFLRRIPFVLNFPFPSKEARAEIWRRVFPKQTPTKDLNYERLAQLNVTGGNIRSIALNSAVLAADANEPVRMEHIFSATQTEYIKLGALLTSSETRGWFK